jgi:hypothetical protein
MQVMLCYGREDPWVVPAWGQKAKRDIGDMCVYYEVQKEKWFYSRWM